MRTHTDTDTTDNIIYFSGYSFLIAREISVWISVCYSTGAYANVSSLLLLLGEPPEPPW